MKFIKSYSEYIENCKKCDIEPNKENYLKLKQDIKELYEIAELISVKNMEEFVLLYSQLGFCREESVKMYNEKHKNK